MHFAFLFVLFTFRGFHSSHFSSHFSSPFRSLFDHSSAKRTKRSRKVDRKVAEKEPKMATVNDPNTRMVAEELLIDFRKLLGKHSGENMAEAVWETLVMYGIEGRVVITCNLSKLICLPM